MNQDQSGIFAEQSNLSYSHYKAMAFERYGTIYYY